jgi:hypothetical protein
MSRGMSCGISAVADEEVMLEWEGAVEWCGKGK